MVIIWPKESELIIIVSRLVTNPVSHAQGVSNAALPHAASDLLKESKQHYVYGIYETWLNEQ